MTSVSRSARTARIRSSATISRSVDRTVCLLLNLQSEIPAPIITTTSATRNANTHGWSRTHEAASSNLRVDSENCVCAKSDGSRRKRSRLSLPLWPELVKAYHAVLPGRSQHRLAEGNGCKVV